MAGDDPLYTLQQVFAATSEPERPHLLRALGSDAGRQAYADWLDRHDPPRGEALRLEPRLRQSDDPAAAARLRELLVAIDPAWCFILRASAIHNCGAGHGAPPRVRFRLVCAREWATLAPTGEPGTRLCDGCGERVHRCTTGAEANARALRGECIAVDPGMAHDQVTGGRALMVGRPDYLAMWAERLWPA